MRYKVQGARRDAGEIVTLIIEASSEPRAQFKANQQGILVERCKQISMAQPIPSMNASTPLPVMPQSVTVATTAQIKSLANAKNSSTNATQHRLPGRHSFVGIAACLLIAGGSVAAVALRAQSKAALAQSAQELVEAAERQKRSDVASKQAEAASNQSAWDARQKRNADALRQFLGDVNDFREASRTFLREYSEGYDAASAFMAQGKLVESLAQERRWVDAGKSLFGPAAKVQAAAARIPSDLNEDTDAARAIADVYCAAARDVIQFDDDYNHIILNDLNATQNNLAGQRNFDVDAGTARQKRKTMLNSLLKSAHVAAEKVDLFGLETK